MKTLPQHTLLNEITRVTQMLYMDLPESNDLLDKTALSTEADLKEMSFDELNEYLTSLEMQWKSYRKVHGIRKFKSHNTYLKHYIQLIYHPVRST